MNPETSAVLVGAVLVALFGVLLVWLARACRRGTFPRQALVGYRTPTTLRDDAAWVAVHRAWAPCVLIAGVGALIGACAAVLVVYTPADHLAPAFLGGSLVWVVLLVLVGVIPARAAARAAAHEYTNRGAGGDASRPSP